MNWIVLALLLVGHPSLADTQTNTSENYLMGRPDSPVKIDLFSDFECPACRAFFLDTISPLLEEYSASNKVAVVFHDFPLPSHASSKAAARYSLAAKCLGRDQYIKVIKYLYTCQAEWTFDGNIQRVVARILSPGELARVDERLKDPALEQTVEREVALGNQRKVESTPTFFVTMGGKEQRVVGGLSLPVLNAFIVPNLK
jgi:protein-disulfide isomerase